MAGKKFLNPIFKVVICLLAIIILGFFSHDDLVKVVSGEATPDKMLIARLLVMVGFLYLLAQSVRELTKKNAS